MDLPEPPRVVFEQPAPCADSARAEDLLRRAIEPSVAPHGGWTVRVRLARDGATLRADGEITDEAEAPVAHRALAEESTECASLAKAAGVWASLVLDQELGRAQHVSTKDTSVQDMPEAVLWPAPQPHESPSPEAQVFLKNPDDRRSFEVGASSWLGGGLGSGVLGGASLFVVGEVGNAWFLRPQISVGWTVSALATTSDPSVSLGSTGFDACKRMPGNYLDRRGIQFDVCGGGEVGFRHTDGGGSSAPFIGVGPSVGLRGELGSDLSVMLRGLAELSLIEGSAGAFARTELALSWRLR